MPSSTTSFEKENMNGPCKVCEKPSNGLHYGVRACDSCKCFFARSLKRSTESLVCSKDSNCNLFGRQPKTICSYCRFQKCVKVGMSSKSYRPDSQVQKAFTSSDMNSQLPSPSSSLQSSELMEINVKHLFTSATMPPGKENISGACKVCEKPGHAIHYGVWTCDSCKWFFTNSLRRGTESLFCHKGSSCDLSSSNPFETCKYCRFQKCVKLGMKNKSYQYRPDSQAQGVLTPNYVTSQLPRVPHQVCKVISQNAELTLVKAWTDYAEEIEADIRSLLPFIDELQDSFNSHDKAILLKRSAFQIYLLRRIRALNPYGLLLSDGRVIKLISLQFLYGTPLINEMLQVVSRILQLGCTDEDIAMFITIVYYKPGRIKDLASLNLQNPENLSPAQQKFKNLFVKHAESRSVDQKVFQDLINLWPELERLSEFAISLFVFNYDHFRGDAPGKIGNLEAISVGVPGEFSLCRGLRHWFGSNLKVNYQKLILKKPRSPTSKMNPTCYPIRQPAMDLLNRLYYLLNILLVYIFQK
ncbi:hypothetical protein CAEBREN_02528 [Caenorhabditis brenneri]|uniref:Uncharacterized protein n=1 Tax=Caenorhabditis brenneri TaxID=135651 RepID=G0P341_CAEBE|nr:hypothetical protein CAEBREN_02528 [Caenorhabditis brenneri]